MRKLPIPNKVWAIFALLLASSNQWSAPRPQEGATQSLNFSNLTLEIAAPKEGFNELEPIPLTITLSNKTDQTIIGHMALDFTYNHINLFVNLLGGPRRRIETLSMLHKFTAASSGEIKPGGTHHVRQLIDIDLDKIFPYPGEYQLQAELIDTDGQRTIKSNQVTIRILEPSGLDRQALDFIKNNSNPSYFLNGYDRIADNKPLSILEEFVSRFSETAYGDYAVFQLGEAWFAKKDYEKVVKHFEKLARKSDFVFSEKVKDYLGEAKEKIKQHKP